MKVLIYYCISHYLIYDDYKQVTVCIRTSFQCFFVCLSSLIKPVILLEDKSFLSMIWKMEFYDPTENLLQHFEDLSPVMTLGESGESVFVCVCVWRESKQTKGIMLYLFS